MTRTERPTPWTIVYADGAANVYRFTQASAGAEVAFEYTPVTPERSSTGSYSGGEPRQVQLPGDDARIDDLWRRVELLERNTAAHGPDRNKGTGAFAVTTPAGKRDFIIEMGAALDDIHQFMQQFRR